MRAQRALQADGVSAGWRPETGSGLFGTIFGITMFLGFLFFAVQLLFNLYATSVVTSVTHDAARRLAALGPGITRSDIEVETRRARQLLGAYGRDPGKVRFEVVLDPPLSPERVRVRVHAENPRLLPAPLDQLQAFDVIERTATVRVEQFVGAVTGG